MSKLNLLENLIENKSIRVHLEAKDWKDAIKLACLPLEQSGVINEKYYNEILNQTAKYGPYYVIAPQLAMPHASATEDCVFGNGFSLITLRHPVVFENDQEVSVLIGLAAKDGETHTQIAIPQIIAVFEDPDNVTKIQEFKTEQEIIDFIKSVDYTKYLP
ncbi:PTS sugar transporter subunit IIA [Mycoplasma sp. NEAQ87857]|uniref:PTS sugar transporter subunit IIA n=1 Tax=Mycoplasma sp. NEAQ87857 TaxID=2683967 RepID=UPI003519F0CA